MPTIACAMIVKNEESFLPTALDSLKGCVTEIVVVDTGSTDYTVEIAKSYGARVYHSPWTGDFSHHRNESIARSTGDWVLILDADEELAPNSADQIRRAVADCHPISRIGGLLVTILNRIGGSNDYHTAMSQPRLFRRSGLSYSGRVHNQAHWSGNLQVSPIQIIHRGYAEESQDPELAKLKTNRRISQLREWIEDEPNNPVPRTHLAYALLPDPDWSGSCLTTALKGLELLRSKDSVSPGELNRAHYPIMAALAHQGQWDRVLTAALESLKDDPSYPDAAYFLTLANFQLGMVQEAVNSANLFIESQVRYQLDPTRTIDCENMTVSRIDQVLGFRTASSVILGEVDLSISLMRGLRQRGPDGNKSADWVLEFLRSQNLTAIANLLAAA